MSPASAHTAPLRPRLGSRAGSHSAHPQPRVLPVRCHHRSALPSLANRFSQWIHLACTAAPSSCEKWPLAHAPAIGSGRSLAPAFAAAAAPGSGPSRGARKRWFTWQGFACPVAAACASCECVRVVSDSEALCPLSTLACKFRKNSGTPLVYSQINYFCLNVQIILRGVFTSVCAPCST